MRMLGSVLKFIIKTKLVTPLRAALVALFAPAPNRVGWDKRLLIINLEALGDLVLFTSVLKHYKRRFPDTHITLLIKQGTGFEVFAAGYYVDDIVLVPYSSFAMNPLIGLRIISDLRRRGFSRVINHDFSASEIMGKIIATSLRANEVVGYEGMKFEYRNPFDFQQSRNLRIVRDQYLPRYTKVIPAISDNSDPSGRLPHVISHYIIIYEGATGFAEQDYATELPRLGDTVAAREKFGLVGEDYALVNVGASVAYKRWPKDRFAAMARILSARKITPVFVGAFADAEASAAVTRLIQEKHMDITGKTSLGELVELMRGSIVLLTNDTASIHIAVAIKHPSICVTGGGQYGMFQDYGYPDTNVWVAALSPCYGDNWRCGRDLPPNEPSPCIAAISVPMVEKQLSRLLSRVRQNPPPSVGLFGMCA